MANPAFPLWTIPVFFVALWVVVCLAVSRWSGWALLAGSFRLESDFTGRRWSWQSGTMRGGCNYNNCLVLGCDPRGVYLGVSLWFRVGHPALLIPWNQIEITRRRYFLFDYVQLLLGREERIPLLLRPRAVDHLRSEAGERWPGSVN